MDIPRAPRRRREISLIPLIDVAMFLLIFFMVAGTLEKFQILPITPPTAESGKLVDEGHVVILLGTHDELVVDDELVPGPEAMEERVRAQLTSNPNKVITLNADATIPAQRMIAVMDRLKLAGAKNLSIVTQSEGAPHGR